MPNDALPCIACGRRLENVLSDAENQPYDGVSFTSYGNYGSTVFDPLDGTFIEISVCDRCLTKAGDDGRVLVSRTSRPAHLEIPCGNQLINTIVGNEQLHNQVYVSWRKDLPGYEDDLQLERSDLDNLPRSVILNVPAEVLAASIDDFQKRNPF